MNTKQNKQAAKTPEYLGVKASIIGLSLLGILGGWGALAVGQIKEAQAKQIDDARAKQAEQTSLFLVNQVDVPTSTVVNQALPRVVQRPVSTQKIVVKPNIPRKAIVPAPVRVASNKTVTSENMQKNVAVSPPVLRDVSARVRTVARSRSSR
jgi:hypothetical protein